MNINLNDFVRELYNKNNEKDILISNGIEYFLEYYKHNKRFSTYSFYKSKLYLINDFFIKNNVCFFSQINDNLLLNYISYLHLRKNKNITINKNVGVLLTMIRFLVSHGLINEIKLHFKKLNESQPKIDIIGLDTFKQIIEHIKSYSPTNQLIFYLIATTGIRRTEIVHIKTSNIDIINNNIYLEYTKNGHGRYIFFADFVKSLILKHLKYKKNSTYLFSESNGSIYSVFKIDHLFRKIKVALNLPKFSPHMLRHTFATNLLLSTDIEIVRLLLGHESYTMTKRYLHIKNKKLKDVSLSYNPIAELI